MAILRVVSFNYMFKFMVLCGIIKLRNEWLYFYEICLKLLLKMIRVISEFNVFILSFSDVNFDTIISDAS